MVCLEFCAVMVMFYCLTFGPDVLFFIVIALFAVCRFAVSPFNAVVFGVVFVLQEIIRNTNLTRIHSASVCTEFYHLHKTKAIDND